MSDEPLLVLVCGSREWRDGEAIRRRLLSLPRGSTIMHGGARGADQIAGVLARAIGFQVEEYPADWKRLGRSAGAQRTLAMLDEHPDLVLAFWLDNSSGTELTITEANSRGIEVEIVARSST